MTTLKTFIQSLDPKALPRVLRIISGVYYQGSVYELFGNECCLPTGEEIKVTGIKIHKVTANFHSSEDNQGLQTINLPLDFPGFFQIETDTTPYLSVEEIVSNLPFGPARFGHPCFYSHKDIKLGNITIKTCEKIMFNSVEEVDGVLSVNCGVVKNSQNLSFPIALSYRGEFYECQDDQIYTLKEIVERKIPRSRKRTVFLHNIVSAYENVTNPFPDNFKGPIVLSPVYEVQAVMRFRKDIVHILSDLDIEVKDVTEHCDVNCFVQPLSLLDIFERTCKEFPMVAEIIEEPIGCPCQHAYNVFKHGSEIVFHKKVQAQRTLASEIRSDSSQKHFLIPRSYKGKFKRRPRAFPTAYDLEIGKSANEPLHVVATKAYDSVHEKLSSILVGDQFLVLQRETVEMENEGIKTVIDVLQCEKIVGNTYEKSLLPMYIEGGFVEVIHDKKQYSLSELSKTIQFPFNVKVSVRDLNTVGEDGLAAIPCLQLEEEITDAYLLVSMVGKPKEVWEIPVHRVSMSVQLVNKVVEEPAISPSRTYVEEITEEQYYMVRRYENPAKQPPPRPPKMPMQMPTKPACLSVSVLGVSNPPKPPKPPRSSHVDSSKNYLGPSSALASELKNRKEMVCAETEKVTNWTNITIESTKALKDCLQQEQQVKQDCDYFDETVIDEIRKKLKDNTCHIKPHPK